MLPVDNVELPIFALLLVLFGDMQLCVFGGHAYSLTVSFHVHNVVHMPFDLIFLFGPHVHGAWSPMTFECINLKTIQSFKRPTILGLFVELLEDLG